MGGKREEEGGGEMGGGREEEPQKRMHLSNDAKAYFNPPIRGPDDFTNPPDWFITELKRISTSDPPVPSKTPIVFENTVAAAKANELTLRSFTLFTV